MVKKRKIHKTLQSAVGHTLLFGGHGAVECGAPRPPARPAPALLPGHVAPQGNANRLPASATLRVYFNHGDICQMVSSRKPHLR